MNNLLFCFSEFLSRLFSKSVLLATFFLSFSSWATPLSPFEESCVTILGETFQRLGQEESESLVWPGFHPEKTATLFSFSQGQAVAFALPWPSSLWEQKEAAWGRYLFCSFYPSRLPLFNPKYPLGDSQVFLFSLEEARQFPQLPLLTFFHERFHLYQLRYFVREKIQYPAQTAYQEENLLALIEAEIHWLTRFLLSPSRAEKQESLQLFLALHQEYLSLIPEEIARFEAHQQKMEGIADYVSVQALGLTVADFHKEAALLRMRELKIKGSSFFEDVVKGRHYFTGAVLALGLDFCGVKQWKEVIEKEGVFLDQLLQEALGESQEVRQQRLDHWYQTELWQEIKKNVHLQSQEESAKEEKLLSQFQTLEGVVVQLKLPQTSTSASGKFNGRFRVRGQTALIGDSSVTVTEGGLWRLEFMDMPLVFEGQAGERTFKMSASTLLEIDGQKISLAAFLESGVQALSFSQLQLEGSCCHCFAKRAGKIFVKENKSLTIQFL